MYERPKKSRKKNEGFSATEKHATLAALFLAMASWPACWNFAKARDFGLAFIMAWRSHPSPIFFVEENNKTTWGKLIMEQKGSRTMGDKNTTNIRFFRKNWWRIDTKKQKYPWNHLLDSSWWFQPLWNICSSKLKIGVKTKYLKPPPRFFVWIHKAS